LAAGSTQSLSEKEVSRHGKSQTPFPLRLDSQWEKGGGGVGGEGDVGGTGGVTG
jgi:hypothetical protein